MIRATIEKLKHDAFKGDVIGDNGKDEQAQSKPRTWQDSTGNFTPVAEFVGMENGQVQLRKSDGAIISLPIDKLSRKDQDYLKKQ